MDNLEQLIFIDNLPTVDLHGLDSDTAKVVINDFINDNYKMGNKYIVIIHGIGKGILRKTTAIVLASNKKVLEYKTYYYNNGCTVAHIDLKTKNK